MVEVEKPPSLNVATAILKLQGDQERAPYYSIMNATDKFGPSRATIRRMVRKLREQTEQGDGTDLSR